MKISEIDYVLKRYKMILNYRNFSEYANGETAVAFYVGNRKEELTVTDEHRILMEVIGQVIESESDLNKKILTELLLRGKTDIYVMANLPISRSAYYKKKLSLKFKIYCLCACKGLLKYRDIFSDWR